MSIPTLTKRSSAKYADIRDSVQQALDRVLAVQRRIKEIENHIRNNPASAGELADDMSRQRAKLAQEQVRHRALAGLAAAIEAWLLPLRLRHDLELRDAPEKHYEGVQGETCAATVRRLRKDIDELSGERTQVSRALLPVQDLTEMANAYVDALVEMGKPRLGVADDKLSVIFPIEGYADKAVALLAWMDRDMLKGAMSVAVSEFVREQYAKGLIVLSQQARVAKLADLDRRILALEREVEFFVCLAETEGTTIPRRDSADPAAILGVEVERIGALRAEILSGEATVVPGTGTGAKAKARSA